MDKEKRVSFKMIPVKKNIFDSKTMIENTLNAIISLPDDKFNKFLDMITIKKEEGRNCLTLKNKDI